MLKQDVINYFGNENRTARALRITRQGVNKWSEKLPDCVQFKVELVTKGELKSDETLLRERLSNGKH